MSVLTTCATATAAEVSAASGVTVAPNIIQTILAALMSLLTGCIPVAKVADRMASPRTLDLLMIRRACREHAPNYDQEILRAAVLDQAQLLTNEQWATAYAEAGAVK